MITVLVASYNGSRYIKQQLDSILAQDEKDIHILVSDDCSADGSGELLKEYEERHRDRILVLFRRKPSGGAAAHFLKLLKLMADADHNPDADHSTDADHDTEALPGPLSLLSEYEVTENQLARLGPLARADYFMLSDQDDVWLPQKARMLSDKMKEMEGEPGHSRLPLLVHSDLTVTDEELRPIADSFFRYQKISPERTRLPQLLVQNNVTGGAVMLSRSMLPYLQEIPGVCLMHDAWLALIASCFGEIGWVDRPLYYYRQHGGNTLGAEKGDNLDSVRARVKDGGSARENYRKMFGQAECFYHMFRSCLNREQQETLEAFIRLPRCGRLGKMGLMVKYGFTKNTLVRTLGQCCSLGTDQKPVSGCILRHRSVRGSMKKGRKTGIE